MDQAQILGLMRDHGTAILMPLAVLEGPVVTVLAGWLASLGVMSLTRVFVIVVLADLVGDTILYLIGRFALMAMPARWRVFLKVTPRHLVDLRRNFRTKGPHILLFGKLTHAAGFAVLMAAGAGRMRFGDFLIYNLLATLPKSATFLALGYLVGSAAGLVESWLGIASVVVLAVSLVWLYARRRAVAP